MKTQNKYKIRYRKEKSYDKDENENYIGGMEYSILKRNLQ